MEFLRRLQADDNVRAETLRAIGGLLIGLAAVVIAIRKSTGPDEPWSALALLLVFALPALVLFGGGVAAAQTAPYPRPWHAVWMVSGIVLLYLTTQQMIEVVEGDTGAPLNVAWTFAVVAVASMIAAREAFVRFGWLAAGLAASVTFFAVCDEILADGVAEDLGTFRDLCMVLTLLLLGVLFRDRKVNNDDDAAELLTAAGIVFVLGTGVVALVTLYAGSVGAIAAAPPIPSDVLPEPSLAWDVVLGLGSLALIVVGAWIDKRGPVYVGSVGLLFFTSIIGSDLDNPAREGSLIGWPLVLAAAAIVALVASVSTVTQRKES